MNNFAETLQLFLNGFTARDLAEPLPSFDDTTSVGAVRDAIDAQQLEVFGIRKSGIIAGWMSREDATNATKPLVGRRFDKSWVISDAASLNVVDKGQIVARDERLRRHTRFASRREVEELAKALQDLRNNLAHSQELSSNWDVIHDLATNLHRIVLGPAPDATPPTMT